MTAIVRAEGNVSDVSRERRLRMGVSLFAVALTVGVLLVKLDVDAGWRILLVLPFWFAAQAFFAALCKT